MKVEFQESPPAEVESPLVSLPWPQGASLPAELEPLDAALGGTLVGALDGGDFTGKKGEELLLYPQKGASSARGPRRVLVVGVGARADLTAERLREAAGRAAARARAIRTPQLALWLPESWLPESVSLKAAARATTEGVILGAWRFDELRTEFEDSRPTDLEAARIVVSPGSAKAGAAEGVRVGRVLAAAQTYARELVSRPGNIANPRYLAAEAERVGLEHGFEVRALDEKALESEGMSALLAVAAGSDEPPRFIVMEYGLDRGGPPLVLVGKGVTFDAGGLSLKTAQGMESMKYDKAGACAVIGAMRAIAELELAVPVVGLVPSVENLPSGHALRPGDVIRSHSGRTIEVLNTDAEGRLILADALSYAARYEPGAIVDVATLTGACVVALGHHAIGLMANDAALSDEVREAGERAGERVWPLPLWDEYGEQLKSEVADIKNTGGRPAGTITAGLFLSRFVGSTPWAHLDIAGTAWAEQAGPYQPKGPTGYGVRLLAEWVSGRAG